MKFVYTEEIIKGNIERLQKEEIATIIKERIFKEPMAAVILKRNSDSGTTSCILSTDSEGLLIVIMDSFKVEKYYGYEYLRFSDMQGIQIKRKWLSIQITIQCRNGMRYKIQITKKSSKWLPNQHEYLERLVSDLEMRNLHEMKNERHKRIRRRDTKYSLIYGSTLIMILIPGVSYAIMHHWNIYAFIFLCIFLFIIHIIVVICVGTYLDRRKGREFTNEYKTIIQEYEQTKDDEQLLRQLLNMKHQPQTLHDRNRYYMTLSTSYARNGEKEAAIRCLERIETDDRRMLNYIESQKIEIEKE